MSYRSDAKYKGLTRYYTGKPCPQGHLADRFTANGRCVQCTENYANSDSAKQKAREWARKNRDKVNETKRKHREKNREAINKKGREYIARNRPRYNLHWQKYNSRKMESRPSWADDAAINFFYECRPAGCHVDHVVPLQGKTVCGLHVENNLQWLPRGLNQSKGNRWED